MSTTSTDDSEATPLLATEPSVYDRFTRREKFLIVAVVSWVGYLPCRLSSFPIHYESETKQGQYLYQDLSCPPYLMLLGTLKQRKV